jgi:membrane protein implicated in regulation of membrane protease activity
MFGNVSVDMYIAGWLGLLVLLLLVEIATVGLTTIWFVAGCIVALIAYGLGFGMPVQIVLFLVVSLLLLYFTRPWAMRYLNASRIKTNYEGIIGKVIKLQEDVDNVNETGKAVVNGVDWTVRTEKNGVILKKGTLVKVLRVSGVKLIVEKYKEE